ncbi:hypothetical protein NDA10_000530 [Ustilago hordei]|uniref:Uncharacterized protein n=1 Tax=Ustilago hordei TaxID=120017 RepID=I2FSG1_USTHO|nr:uncharacterized protein UHO2_05750 [Ustilago hordei]KAJ1042070.1 hypothetical protein NDA10_000530 [Ustilago hordei]CCF49854.1 uncharacterized protein UHOR_08212 [Ustilago hordei]SYW84790.1 uncharacterized protein UHO2_05750 [Ustilago hordei]
MPTSASADSNTAAQSSAATTSKHNTHRLSRHHPAAGESSDAETEPLPYDDDEEDDDSQHDAAVMNSDELARHTAAAAEALGGMADTEADAPGELDVLSIEHSHHGYPGSAHAQQEHSDDDDDDDDADGHHLLPASQLIANHNPNSNMSSPQKTGGFTGDEFSDESELTDEDEDQNQDEDGSSLSDDDLGGSDDEEEEEDDDDDDDDNDDPDSNTHEDEAAQALAALTAGTDGGAGDDASATAGGLDALAALATAGETADHHGHDDQEDEEDDASQQDGDDVDAHAQRGSSLDHIGKPGRLQQLCQKADGDDMSSDITPEPEEHGEADGAAGADDAYDAQDGRSPRTTDLDLIASMKKRAAATGGATSLLEPEQLVDSLPGSAASSRAASPLGDEDQDADKPKMAVDREAGIDATVAQAEQAQAEQAQAEHLDTAAGTPAPDTAEHDEDTSTDEAAIRRQEAMEALTKIEIGFAMLRDRLYVERLQEISKEGQMILDGTHPELLHLTKAIEMRRQRRTQLVEMRFEQQEQQYQRVAKAEEFAAWSIWRSSCASLRRDMMDEFSRKRRRLDREKRTLDAPRPARKHQIFETELVRNPDRLHIPLQSSAQIMDDAENGRPGRKGAAKRKAMASREIDAGDQFVAYPDLKGLAEADVMTDIEQMGIRPVGVPPGMYDPFYGAPLELEFQNPDMYAMYGPEAAAAAQAAQINGGFPYGLAPGARGMPPPPPGAMMGPRTPQRHGMHLLPPPPPPGMMHAGMEGMMGFDPYAAAEMERAARMHHREQQARMEAEGMNHRSSPFPPDMYPPYPPQQHFMPGPPMPSAGGRGGMQMPPSPTPPRRSSGSGRKDRASVDEGVHVSGRGRGQAKSTGGRSKQARSSQGAPPVSPQHSKPPSNVAGGGQSGKPNLPPPPSLMEERERDHKVLSIGAAPKPPKQSPTGFVGQQPSAPIKSTCKSGGRSPAATPVAVASSMGAGNARLYPPSNQVAAAAGAGGSGSAK